jgi:hypothetical protein
MLLIYLMLWTADLRLNLLHEGDGEYRLLQYLLAPPAVQWRVTYSS